MIFFCEFCWKGIEESYTSTHLPKWICYSVDKLIPPVRHLGKQHQSPDFWAKRKNPGRILSSISRWGKEPMPVRGGNRDWIGSGSLIKEKRTPTEEVESSGRASHCFVPGIAGNGHVQWFRRVVTYCAPTQSGTAGPVQSLVTLFLACFGGWWWCSMDLTAVCRRARSGALKRARKWGWECGNRASWFRLQVAGSALSSPHRDLEWRRSPPQLHS